MEIQLQELIEQIKQEGVTAAEQEAAGIRAAAEAEAEKILSEAKAEAAKILSQAKSESERTLRVSEESIRQAGRNLLISFRESVGKELDALLRAGVNGVYADRLPELIEQAISAWIGNAGAENISVLLSEEDQKTLEQSAYAALRDRLNQGVTLKAGDRMDGGFCISQNGGQAYYDYSAEAVTELLSAYLSPKVAALLKEAEA